ncbi:MAG: 3-alpha,7-alpha,12-alpha-trihydroxy-5-beta-cholest-24-enoyl-CoA hydratase, partial [Proteobacteria bacterium]|nr:3-alpha,7-alpha,12-alpha-trihydroxy-5-beta-cholest-24-enoyl-CoA hydratase [Pseudomonadota bacterium]
MALNYEKVISTGVTDLETSYGDKESMLYAQSIGFGRDPIDRKELAYVYEQGTPLRTVPTLASAIVPNMFPPDLGWDYGQVLHVEQRLTLYRPLPPAAELLLDKRVVEVFDR